MVVTIVILSLLVAILGYLTYINFRKAERIEQYCEAYVRFVSILFFRVKDTRDKMKEIDRLGAFQADDEVGFIFKELDGLSEDLYQFMSKYVNTKDTKTESEQEE